MADPVIFNGDTIYRNEEGQLHREDGPALITEDGTQYFYVNGVLHGSPAVILPNGDTFDAVNGVIDNDPGYPFYDITGVNDPRPGETPLQLSTVRINEILYATGNGTLTIVNEEGSGGTGNTTTIIVSGSTANVDIIFDDNESITTPIEQFALEDRILSPPDGYLAYRNHDNEIVGRVPYYGEEPSLATTLAYGVANTRVTFDPDQITIAAEDVTLDYQLLRTPDGFIDYKDSANNTIGKVPYYGSQSTLSTSISLGNDSQTFADVAFSGDYDDLINKPTLFSGDYNDLINKPTINDFEGTIEVGNVDIILDPNQIATEVRNLDQTDIVLANPDGFLEYTDEDNNVIGKVPYYGDATSLATSITLQVSPGSYDIFANSLIHTIANNAVDRFGFSGNYNDLTNKPTIPSSFGDLSGSIADSQVPDAFTRDSELSSVAFSGSYNDLTNKPTINDFDGTIQVGNVDIILQPSQITTQVRNLDQTDNILANPDGFLEYTDEDNNVIGKIPYYGDATSLASSLTIQVNPGSYDIFANSIIHTIANNAVDRFGFSGDYDDLTNKPSIPSSFTDLSGSISDGQIPNAITRDSELADVATSGDYSDLSNTPNLAAVATSGSYNDLTNRPNFDDITGMLQAANADIVLDPNQIATEVRNLDQTDIVLANPNGFIEYVDEDNNVIGKVPYYGDATSLASSITLQVNPGSYDIFANSLIHQIANNAVDRFGFSGDYDDLTNKPIIPSSFTDLSGSISDGQIPNAITRDSELADVATTGSFDDLVDVPDTIGFSGDYDDLTNKPNLATVATSGSYNDLTNRPNFDDITGTLQVANVDITLRPTDITTQVRNLDQTDNILANPDGFLEYKNDDNETIGKVPYYGDATNLASNLTVQVNPGSYDIFANSLIHQIANNAVDRFGFSGDYDDLTNKPTIPSSFSDLSGSIADGQIPNAITRDSELADVATSGDYSDLTNKPSIPSSFSDLSGSISDGQIPSSITRDSELATVATSGSYNDLNNTPNLATVATTGSYDDLTDKPDTFANSDIILDPNQITTQVRNLDQTDNILANPDGFIEYTDEDDNVIGKVPYYGDATNIASAITFQVNPGSYNVFANSLIYSIANNAVDRFGFSGDYDDLTNKPTIPSSFADLSGSISDSQIPNAITRDNELADVATSGNFSDLNGSIADGQIPSSITRDSELADVATSGDYSDLNNTPNLAAVAISGSYDDLIDKPVIALSFSDLSGSIADGQIPSSITRDSELATVATSGDYNNLQNTPFVPSNTLIETIVDNRKFSGNYNDLTNRPTIPSSFADLSGSIADGQIPSSITRDSELATVATTGSFDDLVDKPTFQTIVTVSNSDIRTIAINVVDEFGFSGDYDDLTNTPFGLANSDIILDSDSITTQIKDLDLQDRVLSNPDGFIEYTDEDDNVIGKVPYYGDATTIASSVTVQVNPGSYNIFANSLIHQIANNAVDRFGFSGDYDDLTNKPTIPSSFSDLSGSIADGQIPNAITRDSELADVATSGDYSDLNNTPNLATVAISGSYDDLIDKPVIALSFSDLSGSIADGQIPSSITRDSELADVATSGNYSDLSNTPFVPSNTLIETIVDNRKFSGNYNDLTNRPNIPSAFNDLSGSIADGQIPSSITRDSELATVATTGSFDDLVDKPTFQTIVTVSNSDIRTIAINVVDEFGFSGDYDDLINRPTIPSSFSDLTGSISDSQIPSSITRDSELSNVAMSGDYRDLTNRPTIPGSFSDLSGSIADGQIPSGITRDNELASVATSGLYTDLSNRPFVPSNTLIDTIATNAVSDHGFSGDYADLTNKPNFADVATSGSYDDLTNKPVIEVGNTIVAAANAIIEAIAINVVDVHGFSGNYNDLTNKPTIPSSFADLSGSIADSQIPSGITRDSELADIATTGNFSDLNGSIADSQIPSGITRDNELASVATSGSYNDLSNRPTIPGSFSDLSGSISDSQIPSSITRDSELSNVATSGSYDDLTNKPDIPSSFSDLSGSVSNSQIPSSITRDSELSRVATTGAFSDLLGAPSGLGNSDVILDPNQITTQVRNLDQTDNILANPSGFIEYKDEANTTIGRVPYYGDATSLASSITLQVNPGSYDIFANSLIHQIANNAVDRFGFSGDYDDLTNRPSIPSSFADLSGSIADSQIPNAITRDSELADVATSGNFSDLNGSIADSQIPSGITRDSELADVAISGSYDDLLDKPTIALSFSDLSGSIADSQIPNGITRDSELADVATTGNFSDLNGSIADGQIPSTITRDLELHAVAISGDYNDLSNKPTAGSDFSGSYDDLSDKPFIPTNTLIDTIATSAVNDHGFSGDYEDLTNKPEASNSGRTSIYTVPDATTTWNNNASTVTVSLTQNMNSFAYITISFWSGQHSTNRYAQTFTFAPGDMVAITNPGTGQIPSGSGIFVPGGGQSVTILIAKSQDGMSMYFDPRGNAADTGKIMGIWGGDF